MMLGQHLLNRVFASHGSRTNGRLFLKHLPLHQMIASSSQDLHANKHRLKGEKTAKWIIQRDKRVLTFKATGTAEAPKELPIWLLKIHTVLMSDVNLPHPPEGQAVSDPNSPCSSSVDNLISKVWAVSKTDTKALTLELVKRMDSMTVEQILTVADIFCLKKMWVPMYFGAMIAFVTEMSELLELTPSQLARLAFHTTCQGGASPDFMFAHEKKTLELIDDLTLNEIAVICHMFFNCQTRIRSMDLLNQISQKLLKELDSLNFWYFAIFMKTFRYSNFLKISFFHNLGDLLIEKNYLKQFNSLPQIMHIAFTYAALRITHPKLFAYILRTCVNSPGYKFRIKDVCKIIWSCGTLLVNKPEDLENIQRMMDVAKQNISQYEVKEFPDNLVDLCIGLCFLNIYSDFFISKVFSPECIPSLMCLNLSRERFYQLNFLLHCIEIEHPGYEGYKLDEETKQIVSSRIGEFPVHKEFVQKKGLYQILKAVQHLVGADKVRFRRILPHFQTSDIIVVWDKVESCYVKETRETFDDINTADKHFVKLAIVVTGFLQTTFDGQPLGLLHTRFRQLNSLGYHVIQIHPEEAYSFVHGDQRESMAVLKERIAREIDLYK